MSNAQPAVHRIILCGLCLPGLLLAQESAGRADIGFQQYYLTVGSQRASNVSGLALDFQQFVPDVGLVSASLVPAMSEGRFRTGEDYLRLKGLPWNGQHWTFSGGDFRLPGQLLSVPFTNLYFPEIAGRGVWLEASHGGRSVGFFYGSETISNSPRVPLRVQLPQRVMGAYFRQKIGNRLLVGARWMRFSNDLEALRKTPSLLTLTSDLKRANSLSLDSVYTLYGPLKWYGEVGLSASEQGGANFGTRNVPISTLVGPILETSLFTVRANYQFQSASYLPLLGYYLGDRQGPFGEVKFHPFEILEIYGSGSQYRNNVAENPTLPTFRSSGESAGLSVRLPAKISVNAQVTLLNLSTRLTDADPWERSDNQQRTATVARPFGRHNLRFTGRDFKQVSRLSLQRQRSGEIEDILQFRHLILGVGVRAQRLIADQSRASLFYHGSAQFHLGPVSVFANIETGSDLPNRTLFATNTISTTIFGGSVNLGKNWVFQGEAYRNNLITELNPQSIFVLQGQGVFVPGALAALNQWSTYFRINRKFRWGKLPPAADLGQYIATQAPLKGSVEGFVLERLLEGNRPVEGVPVSLDEGRTVTTDDKGRFHFAEVAEGVHRVGLALRQLPADFDPGENKENTVVVRPNKLARADLDVIPLAFIQGKVTGPPDVVVENIVVCLLPTDRYTTPDSEGNFYFYNLREGNYELTVVPKTLPEYAAMNQPDRIPVSVTAGRDAAPVNFHFEIHKPEKPVRKVFEKN